MDITINEFNAESAIKLTKNYMSKELEDVLIRIKIAANAGFTRIFYDKKLDLRTKNRLADRGFNIGNYDDETILIWWMNDSHTDIPTFAEVRNLYNI